MTIPITNGMKKKKHHKVSSKKASLHGQKGLSPIVMEVPGAAEHSPASAAMTDSVSTTLHRSESLPPPTSIQKSVPFLRLSNAHIKGTLSVRGKRDDADIPQCGFSSLRDLGLYALLGAILSNPSFTYAQGGLQKLLLSHCKNRYFSLHGAWRRLQKQGYLHRTRIVCGNDHFRDYYTLSHTPHAEEADSMSPPLSSSHTMINGALHLSYAETDAFVASYQPFMPPNDDFTMVSIPMLFDPKLSLSAKGLYAVLARFLRLSFYGADIVITKAFLREVCPEGENSFDRIFRELRQSGYLSLTRTTDKETGKGYYLYTLHPTPTAAIGTVETQTPAAAAPSEAKTTENETETGFISVQNNTPSKKANEATTAAATTAIEPENTKSANHLIAAESITPSSAWDEKHIIERIRDQIEYPCLLSDYPKARLDCIVSIIASVTRKEHSDINGPTANAICKTAPPSALMHIGQTPVPLSDVFQIFSSLSCEDIRYVLDTYETVSQKQPIHHIRSYLTTCLFHAKENLALALDQFSCRLPHLEPQTP